MNSDRGKHFAARTRAINLEHEMIYRVGTTHPLEPTTGSPLGARQYWQVSEATLDGPRIKAALAAIGCDWMAVSGDGYWRPNVRAQFKTDDGAIIFMHYTGLVEQTEAFKAAAEANCETGFGDHYMRLAIHLDTGTALYGWLNTSLFVAQGRLLGTGLIEYQVFRVV